MTDKQRDLAADSIMAFIEGACGPYDWDDFIMPKRNDPDFQLVCDYCNSTQGLYPAEEGWCNDDGTKMLSHLANLLRSSGSFEEVRQFIFSEYRQVGRGDPWGLDPGVTPQSLGGALIQAIGRFFRSR